MRVIAIVATSRSGVIGAAGDIPWRAKGEQQRFRAATMGAPVIMGRKTFESLPNGLPGRSLIVLSRTLLEADVPAAASLDEALQAARDTGADRTYIAGGAAVYQAALPVCDAIYHTVVDVDPPGDVRLEGYPPPEFVEAWSRWVAGEPSFTFRTLVRAGRGSEWRPDGPFGLLG